MDKIASGIIDKLSIFDFFNVIISGGLLLYGISPILTQQAPEYVYSVLDLENGVEKVIVILLICYILGSILKGMQEVFFKDVESGFVKKCLAGRIMAEKESKETGTVKNQYSRKSIIGLAEKLFEDKKLGKFDPEDKDMCECFFDYCEESNAVGGFGSKASQLNESAGFYEQLAIAFFMLALFGVILSLFMNKHAWMYSILYLALGGGFMGRGYNNHKKWAKTVLTTYEAVVDMEAAKAKNNKVIVVKDA